MNQHAAEAIAVAATMETARRRTRRWKVVVAVVILAGVGREVANRVELPRPQVRAAVHAAQAAAPQPVQHPRIQKPAVPSQPTATRPSAAARRSAAAAAARAKRRYDAEVRRQNRAEERGQRIEQRRTQAPSPSRTPRQSRQSRESRESGGGLGALLRTAGQVARTAEQIERGRFNLSRELSRAGRTVERYERR